jgi:hypothetical protein
VHLHSHARVTETLKQSLSDTRSVVLIEIGLAEILIRATVAQEVVGK